jgi:mRNA-degrading endonuclease toxin of MazEF toxin-antitoxin module
MKFQRGEIVLADITYSDRTGSKIRPVLVVSADANNVALDDVILAAISSVTRAGSFTHVFVDPQTPDGQSTGLLHPSYIQCENLFTLDQHLILRGIGRVSVSVQARNDERLKAALELP